MMSATTIFERYEQVRHRTPCAQTSNNTRNIDSILQITDEISAFVFDAFGVLNVGDTQIAGADVRLQQLRNREIQIRVLTNAASYNRDAAFDKFRRLGFTFEPHEIVTSRQAALASLTDLHWGVITTQSDPLTDLDVKWTRLGDSGSDYVEVEGFLFLSSAEWNSEKQIKLTETLLELPRPVVIANADLVAPRDTGFSLEPGHYGHLLADRGIENVRFFGKPFPEVYELIEQSIPDFSPESTAMCGDTLHTDIAGAAARGWRSVLVAQDGLFAGYDTTDFCTKAGLFPTWCTNRI